MTVGLAQQIEGDAEVISLGPDMSVLNAGRREPPRLPSEVFGSCWPMIVEMAESAGCPVDYIGIGLLGVIASIIGGRRSVRPYDGVGWCEPCILWTAIVGDPSSHKSPALKALTAPCHKLESEEAQGFQNRLQEWEDSCELARIERDEWTKDAKKALAGGKSAPLKPSSAREPDKPTRPRYVVGDATMEAVAEILAVNPRGVLQANDELASWIEGFDKYSSGNRPLALELFGGSRKPFDRVKYGDTLMVPFWGLSMVGSVQPEKLSAAMLKGTNDGLASRFLWAWPELIDFKPPSPTLYGNWYFQIARQIDSLQFAQNDAGEQCAAILPLTAPASDIFVKWNRENHCGAEAEGPLFKEFCGKAEGGVLRIALVLEHLAWAAGDNPEPPQFVGKVAIARAVELMDDYLKPMALRVFGDAALPPVQRNAAILARNILKRRATNINASDVRRHWKLPGMKLARAVEQAVDELVDANWLTEAGSREGETKGRMSSDYDVNPIVHGA